MCRHFLHRCEDAAVHGFLDPAQGSDHLRVPHREADPPAGHVEHLGQAVQFDHTISGGITGGQQTRRPAPVEGDLEIGRVVDQHRIVVGGGRHQGAPQTRVGHGAGGIVGIVGEDQTRPLVAATM